MLILSRFPEVSRCRGRFSTPFQRSRPDPIRAQDCVHCNGDRFGVRCVHRADQSPATGRAATSARAPEELLEHRPDRVNWGVLAILSVLILVFSAWAILMPGNARISMNSLAIWITTNFGWYYVLTVTLVVGFI